MLAIRIPSYTIVISYSYTIYTEKVQYQHNILTYLKSVVLKRKFSNKDRENQSSIMPLFITLTTNLQFMHNCQNGILATENFYSNLPAKHF